MVNLQFILTGLLPGEIHERTSWKCGTTPDFSTGVIIDIPNDAINLTSLTTNDVLDPTKKYYAAVQIQTNRGMKEWAAIEMFTPVAINMINLAGALPSPISIPVITTSSDANNHMASFFTISVSGFATVGDSTLDSTTYVIEDITGRVLWTSIRNKVHKNNIIVSNVVLENNQVYAIKAAFHSSSNDTSYFATKHVHVGEVNGVELLTDLSDGTSVIEPRVLRIGYRPGVNNVQWSLIAISGDEPIEIWNAVSTVPEVILPANKLRSGHRYLLAIKTNLDTNPSYFIAHIGYPLPGTSNTTIPRTFFISRDPGNILKWGTDAGLYGGTDTINFINEW